MIILFFEGNSIDHERSTSAQAASLSHRAAAVRMKVGLQPLTLLKLLVRRVYHLEESLAVSRLSRGDSLQLVGVYLRHSHQMATLVRIMQDRCFTLSNAHLPR